MPDRIKMRYSVEIIFDDPETLYVTISDEVDGKPDSRKLITSYRAKSVADAMYDAEHELASLLGLDLL
jgi:hypothetical protein